MISIKCPNCGTIHNFENNYTQQEETCRECGNRFTLPVPASPPPIAQVSQGQAVASLVCGIPSFFCVGLLALPAIFLGHISLSKIKRGRMPISARGIALTGLILGYVNIAIFAAAVLLISASMFMLPDLAGRQESDQITLIKDALQKINPDLGTRQESNRTASCQNNLKQMGLVFKIFANEHKGQKYPKISNKPGQLMAAKDEIYPEYLTDLTVLVCPSKQDQANVQDQVDDTSYFYLGYAVSNEKEVAGFCKAYRERMAKGLPFDEDLVAPAEDGINSSNTLYRLREGIERFYVVDINDPSAASKAQSKLPVLIERPENHEPSGGSVLFLDGHVEFIPYPGKWPMTEETINALKQLDSMGN